MLEGALVEISSNPTSRMQPDGKLSTNAKFHAYVKVAEMDPIRRNRSGSGLTRTTNDGGGSFNANTADSATTSFDSIHEVAEASQLSKTAAGNLYDFESEDHIFEIDDRTQPGGVTTRAPFTTTLIPQSGSAVRAIAVITRFEACV